MAERIVEAMMRVVELAEKLGVTKINEMDGCWEHQVDEKWWIACNGHQETTRNSHGAEVPPFHVYVEYNGWPAGLINPRQGVIAAGEGANERTFIAALRKAAK